MDWTDLQILIPVARIDEAAAIAQMVVPYGFQIEDYSDMLEMVPEIAHIDLIDEALLAQSRESGIIHIYLSPDQSPAEAASYITQQLRQENIPHTVSTASVKEEEWATAWKNYYHPTKIGQRLVVCPTWEEYTQAEGELVLHLDPGMAFGTGTHHTTRLCCQQLEKVVKPGDAVLDMGCGSGILSIAALMLGAKRAVGVDIDPIAVRTAVENAEINGYTQPEFTAVAGDLVTDNSLAEKVGYNYDVIAANIVADVIIAISTAFPRHLRRGGKVVASGVILPRQDEVLAALTAQGLVIETVEEKDGWCAIVAVLPA